MAFRVEIAPKALGDIETAYQFIKKEAPERAAQWLLRLTDVILSLEKSPARCSLAAESEDIGQEIRVLLYGKRHHVYKIFFSIHSSRTIRVFHIRHGAMKHLLADDLKVLIEESVALQRDKTSKSSDFIDIESW